jgi:hypothetical protein
VRLADVTVPVATYTGWALRRAPHDNDGCEAAGQFIPFAKNDAEKLESDPRSSVAARYPSFANYHRKIRTALNQMVLHRLLLCEDALTEESRLIQVGSNRGVPLKSGEALPVASVLPACAPQNNRGHDRDDD